MSPTKYVLITMDDLYCVSALFAVAPPEETGLPAATKERLETLRKRFLAEEGGDVEDIVRLLKKMPICAPCNIESQSASCGALAAQALGRRLGRLIRRARGSG